MFRENRKSENRIRLADRVADQIVRKGVTDVFLVTGGGAMHLNDAFGRQRKLTVTCFHHEQAAAMAADAYFRLSNRLAVVNVTTGPGALNALNGVHGAYVDSLGMVVISGQVKRDTLQTNQRVPLRQLGDQEVDIISIVKPIVKYAARVDDPCKIHEVMEKAFFISTHGRPGPVWIDIPGDVQAASVNNSVSIKRKFNSFDYLEDKNLSKTSRQEFKIIFDKKHNLKIDLIKKKLEKAKRPVILAGTGVRISAMYEEFHKLINILKIPIVTGWNAHDLLENSSAFYTGKPGTQGDRAGNFAVQNADFLLVLGCRLNIRQISYEWKNFAKNAFKIMVDADKSELEKNTLDFDIKIHSLLQDFIPNFLSSLQHYFVPPAHSKYLVWCRKRVLMYPPVEKSSSVVQTNGINPYVFLEKFFNELNNKAVVITANGSACVMGFQVANIKKGQRLFTNSGSASMGYDLPASIGAFLAGDGRVVYCLAGDGSIMMNIQELQTIITNNYPIKILVLNNSGYASIRQTQNNYFPDNIFGTGDEDDGLSFPEFSVLAKAFGLASIRVESLNQFSSKKVKRLLNGAFPALIDIKIDPETPFSPKLLSKKLSDGSMTTPSLEDMAPFLSRDEFRKNIIENNEY